MPRPILLPPLRSALAIAALTLGACAPAVQPGMLAPKRDRVTNEMRDADLETIAIWSNRLAATAEKGGATTGPRAYAVAKAQAWITFAREEYLAEPRDTTADAALAEGRRIVLALERDSIPGDVDRTPYVVGTTPGHDSLWAEAADIKSRPRYALVADEVAAAEVALVRGGRVGPALDRAACRADVHIARAERLLHDADVRSIEVVAEKPAVTESTPVAALENPDRRPRGVTVAVHFALDEATIGAPSARILDSTAAFLARHPKISVALEGHADPRGDSTYNVALSVRRAQAVRGYLAAAGIDSARVLYRGFGGADRAAPGSTVRDYALDRRVILHFIAPDGTELTNAEVVDDLQVEGRKVRRSGAGH